MENLPGWVTRTITIWLTIGSILTLFGANIIGIPHWLPGFFSQDFVKEVLAVVGVIINFLQVIKGTIAGHPGNAVKISSAPNKIAYMLLPWRMAPGKMAA